MSQKVISWISLVLGFKVGMLVTFLFTVTILHEYFDKPWDVFWGTVNSIAGALIGSLIGGMLAYLISMRQTTFQNELMKQDKKNAQQILAERIKSELYNNKPTVIKLHKLLDKSKSDFTALSKALSTGETRIIEGVIVYVSQIEISLALQFRTNLIDLDYLDVHKRLDCLEQIKNSGQLLQSQKVPEYIEITLKRLLKLCKQFNETYE